MQLIQNVQIVNFQMQVSKFTILKNFRRKKTVPGYLGFFFSYFELMQHMLERYPFPQTSSLFTITSDVRGKISCSVSMMVSLEKANKDKTKSSWFDLKDVAWTKILLKITEKWNI